MPNKKPKRKPSRKPVVWVVEEKDQRRHWRPIWFRPDWTKDDALAWVVDMGIAGFRVRAYERRG